MLHFVSGSCGREQSTIWKGFLENEVEVVVILDDWFFSLYFLEATSDLVLFVEANDCGYLDKVRQINQVDELDCLELGGWILVHIQETQKELDISF